MLTLRVGVRQPLPPAKSRHWKGRAAVKEIELASLLVSRVCHDLISPVGALVNGVEVLADEKDPVMRDHAIALIHKSAEQASAKLKLCRLAYGSLGSAGDQVSLGEAREALDLYLKDSRHKLDWQAPPMLVGKDTVKLATNLALAAIDTIPRGGTLRLKAESRADDTEITVIGDGPMPRLTEDLQAALAGRFELAELDGRRIQHFLTGLIARSLGGAISHAEENGTITLTARVPHRPAGVAAA